MFRVIVGAAVCAASLVLPLCAQAESLRVGKAGAEAFSFVPVDVGQQMGFFKKRGIEVTTSAFGGDPKIQQAMAANSIDIGLGSGPGMAFIAKGSPVKAVAATADQPLDFLLVARNDGSMPTLKDLKGHNVGVSGVGSVTNWLVTEIARQQGWGVNGIPRVGLGNDANRIAALKTKSVDAVIVNVAVALRYVHSGQGKVLARFGDLVKNFHDHVIFATDKLIAEHPQALRAFLAGWFDAVKFMHADKAKTLEIAKAVMHTDDATTAAIYAEVMPSLNSDGHFKPKALATLARSFVELKTLPKAPDMGKLYTDAFLPKNQ